MACLSFNPATLQRVLISSFGHQTFLLRKKQRPQPQPCSTIYVVFPIGWNFGEAQPHQRAIAAETGLHRRYVGRIMQIAFLAPDITEAILEGTQPPHMTLETLMGDMPADWNLQRKQLVASSPPNDAGVCA